MKVAGSHCIDLPIDQVWASILDRHVLEEVTPGVTELKEIAPNNYEAKSDIKLGPVRGSFKGKLLVHDISDENSFVLTISQKSSVGDANADIAVRLSSDGDRTNVAYDGEAKLSGVLGRLGQRVLGGVVNSLAKQFFIEFEKKMKENPVQNN